MLFGKQSNDGGGQMNKINLSVDGKKIKVDSSLTILEAALENGIYIPNLCYHPDLTSEGNCRVCVVEVEGINAPVISCKTQVTDGMIVKSDNSEITAIRQTILELIHVNHFQDCTNCKKNNNCQLQKVTSFVGVNEKRLSRMRKTKPFIPVDTSNPFFNFDHNKCILCGICVRTCDEVQGVDAINFGYRGSRTVISTFGNKPIKESVCESCGECVIRCPTGSLYMKTSQIPSVEVKSVCGYCGVGCNIFIGVRGNKVVSISGDRNSIVNKGRLCVKGRFGFEFIHHPERLTTPLIKKDGTFVEASWDEALTLIAEKLKGYNKGQCAALSSARITNEDNYVFQKFIRAVMGTNNIDHCARLCHAPSVAGLGHSLGSGAMTNSIDELTQASTIFSIGSNTTAAHPIIALHIKQAVRKGAKLIVANPKRIDLCKHAEIFMQQKPGTDVVLLMGMIKLIIDEGHFDKKFIENRTDDYDKLVESAKSFDMDKVSQITGVDKELIIKASRIYSQNTPSSIVYAMGITQHTHGTDNVFAISNLALLTGNIGKKSSGVNPLRGQNNVQGACDMGALPNVFPGYQKVSDPDVNAKFSRAWGVELDEKPGLTHLEIFDNINNGNIKVLYQVGENPVLSEANSNNVKAALNKIEFMVVQDIFMSDTAKYAHVVLPAASFAEKNGTFTNTERKVQRIRKAIDPVGDSKEDWWIICEVAKRMGKKGFDFESVEDIMNEISSLTPIYGGIDYKRIEQEGIQWPCLNKDDAGTLFLHSEKFATPNGRGKFIPLMYIESAETTDNEYPLILTTDRSLYHYHTNTMTGRVEGLVVLNKEELLLINPVNAGLLGINDMEDVKITTRRGSLNVKAKITDICPVGVVSMTFHFPETPTNILTNSAKDPLAKIPETKVAAARIEKIG